MDEIDLMFKFQVPGKIQTWNLKFRILLLCFWWFRAIPGFEQQI